METRSNNVLVGVATLLLLAAVVVFFVWLSRFGQGDKKEYDIFFKQSVSGLAKGSAVTFAGVPSGQVEDIKLWRNDPEFVRVRIQVDDDLPILQGTVAQIQGSFTGGSTIQLDGAVKGAPPIVEKGPEDVPVIPTKPGAIGELLNNAPLLLQRLSTLTERLTNLLSDKNQESIEDILANTDRLSANLAASGPELQAAIRETRGAIQHASEAADQIGKLAGTTNSLLDAKGRPLFDELQQTIASARTTLKSLQSAADDVGPAVKTVSTETLPQVNLLVRDLRSLSERLNALTTRIDQQGVTSVVGSRKLPTYKPGK